MPELPEVEVVRRGLEKFLHTSKANKNEGAKILQFEFLRQDLRDPIPVAQFKKLQGSHLLRIERRAKFLIFTTDQGQFVSHLGMTGSWRRQSSSSDLRTHDHIKIHFASGEVWIYCDPRRFGVFDFLDSTARVRRLGHLGPEPLSDEFSGLVLWKSLRHRTSSLKAAIMDQKIVVGVGNIYASEVLFLAKIKPSLRSDKLSRERAARLVAAIKEVLNKAIIAGGSTIASFETAESSSGYFQTQHQVYSRAGLDCYICATPIKSAVIAGRSTYWCSRCQC